MEKFNVKVDNSRVMDSIEKAHIVVTSPTGKSIYLHKNKLNRKDLPKELSDIFWKFCQDPMTNFIGEIKATKEEMRLALQFSNLK